MDVIVVTVPKLVLVSDTTVLNNQPYIIHAGSVYNSWLWSDSSTANTLSVTKAGTYWVRVSYKNCTAADSVKVILMPVLTLPDTVILCSGLTATLNAGAGYGLCR